ncbi:Ubiquitin domain-containing protein 2 [Linnemannia zychae]|nr:Ubiquitin domain-containing protein 2 [Linnemannia zychae]
MGCCTSQPVDDDSEPGYGGRRILALKNHKWYAPAPPPTRTRLEREREEFWDTAPAYDGRPEVWQALRTACCNEDDPDQIQAILNAARITIPSSISPELTVAAVGTANALEEPERSGWSRRAQRQDPMAQLACYDHLGNLYIIPLKILSDPSNLSREDSVHTEESHHGGTSQGTTDTAQRNESKGKAVMREEQEQKLEKVRIRISNSQKEASLLISGTQTTIGQIKAQLLEEQIVSSNHSIRVLFLGRILNDKEKLADITHFQAGMEGTVLQVLVSGA